MAIRERLSWLASKDAKIIDDKYIHIGTADGKTQFGTHTTKIGFDSSNRRTLVDVDRLNTASNVYGGIRIDGGSTTTGFFTHVGAYKSRLFGLTGERPATGAVAGGDSNDMLTDWSYTNRAANTPAGHYARGLNLSLNNRASGTIDALQGAFVSVRQRGDGGAITNLRGAQFDVVHNVGGTAATGQEEGVRVEFQMEANGPTHADTTGNAAFIADQRTDGVYTNLPDGYALRNRGTSSCKGWRYGFDFYDSRAATCDVAEIRMMTADAGGLPCIIASGTATNDAGIVTDLGADTLYADGSLYISVVDSAGKLFQKQGDEWIDLQA